MIIGTKRIDVDRASREELIAYIDDLEMALELSRDQDCILKLKRRFGLTPSAAAILSRLLRGDVCSVRELSKVAHGDSPPSFAKAVIGDHICRLRKKIKPFGASIANEFGVGFYLDPQSLATVRKAAGL
ncbi:MAG: helix-turn-helix domain-containing protein [Ahrensia sp.]|nr:helix-turn-helix domain-containing protein [Ahrensia sp.]